MRRLPLSALGISCLLAIFSTGASASKVKTSDFPLRVHVFSTNFDRFYSHRELEQVNGEGRANLYENGQPQAFDFTYECSAHVMHSPGGETYMARWKKPGRDLQLILPVMGGKPGDMNTCDLKVILKPESAYTSHNGAIGEEPAAAFKKWMDDHQYDPEHGKDQAINPPKPAAPQPAVAQAGKAAQ
jgi:hypothetical protein